MVGGSRVKVTDCYGLGAGFGFVPRCPEADVWEDGAPDPRSESDGVGSRQMKSTMNSVRIY